MSVRSGGSVRRGAVAAISLAACAPLWAAEGDDEVRALTQPQLALGAGIGWVSEDNKRFGQYTGLTQEGLYNLIDLDLRLRLCKQLAEAFRKPLTEFFADVYCLFFY